MKHIGSILVALAILTAGWTPAVEARQQLSLDELHARAMQAYQQLPPVIGLEHARLFSVALQHLYAYEQRLYREQRELPAADMAILAWLHERFRDDLSSGKADVVSVRFRSNDELRRRGAEAVQQLRRQSGAIWDAKSYIGAAANLFAYFQVERNPAGGAVADLRWLEANWNRIATAGGKADDFGPTDWMPTSPRPRGTTVIANHAAAVEHATVAVATVQPTAGGGTDSLRAELAAARAELQRSSQRIRELEASTEQLRDRLAAARRELASQTVRPAGEDAAAALEQAVAGLDAGEWVNARNAAIEALRSGAPPGAAFVIIAKAYAGAADASSGGPVDRALYWLAQDYLLRARILADDREAREIDLLLRHLAGRTPTDADKRRLGWRSGQTLQLDFDRYAWVGEAVIVR
jgi:hypothetical protein